MSTATEAPVMAHGPLVAVADGVWTLEGRLPDMALPRRMVVARRADGRLVIYNAIALDDATRAQLEALGPVGFIVVPIGWHRLDAPRYARLYPEAKVLCPAAATKQVQEKVRVDGAVTDMPADARVSLVVVDGIGGVEAWMLVRGDDGATLCVTDLIFNLVDPLPGLFGFVYGRLMGVVGGAKITPIGRLLMVKDKRALSASLRTLSAEPGLKRLFVAHGAPVLDGADAILRRIADGLHRP